MAAADILAAIETALTAALDAQASGMPVYEYKIGDLESKREAPSVAVKNLTAMHAHWSSVASRASTSPFRPVRLSGVSGRGS